ncbi:MAG: DoxX family protein [Nanoarchaeota archaeon]
MSKKSIRIIYWITTVLFVAFMVFSGIGGLVGSEAGDAVMVGLGYPLYLNMILGIAKILGGVALIQTKWYVIKEWAYAGFTFDILGAAMSFAFAGFGFSAIIVPLISLVVMFISYSSWKKLY